jgi:hypothetical protein
MIKQGFFSPKPADNHANWIKAVISQVLKPKTASDPSHLFLPVAFSLLYQQAYEKQEKGGIHTIQNI